VAVVVVYGLTFPYHPGLRSPNELCRLLQTRAIVEFGELDLNKAIQVYGPVGDLAVFHGHYYPSKAPLMSFAAVPIYFGLRAALGRTPWAVSELTLVFFSRLFLTVLPTLLILLCIRRFLAAYVSPPIADAVTLVYALGTLAFSYSLLFMSHQPSAVLLFAAYFGLWRWSRDEWPERGLALCGALASASILGEYTTAIAVFGLGLFVVLALRQRRASAPVFLRSFGLFLGGALPLTLLLMLYQTRAFGGPLESGYRHLADAAYQAWHEGGFLGIGLPQPRAFFLSFFSPLRGLFVLSPGLLLVGPGLVLLFHRARTQHELKPVAWSTLWIVGAYSYFTSAFSYESWGWTTGPRHLTPLVPFLLLPVGLAVQRARATSFRGSCSVLLAASVLVTSALTFVNYIPDDVSNGLLALAVPLTRNGDLVPSVLCALGLTNPAAGAVIWLGIAAGVAWLFWSLRPQRSVAAWTTTLFTAAIICGFQALTYRDSSSDRAALALLRSIWLAPPGNTFTLLTPGVEPLRTRAR
jgi:hypothetical protein